MTVVRLSLFLLFILLYTFGFLSVDTKFKNSVANLKPALPAKINVIAFGYLKHLVAEILFVNVSVFLGGIEPGVPPKSYADPLANNLEVITTIYPEFIDPYFYTQSFLVPVSYESALISSNILETGIKASPSDFILHFFYSFNYYRYLNDPLKASMAFGEAAKLVDAPPMFSHLSALFAAEGGNIKAGLLSLRVMLVNEKNQVVVESYQKEINTFETALLVENAIGAYRQKYNKYPEELKDVTPEFLSTIPDVKNGFKLIYTKPTLSLQR